MLSYLKFLAPLIEQVGESTSWYVIGGAVVTAFLILRFIVKKIKWLIIAGLVLVVVTLAYFKLFVDTVKYLPESSELLQNDD